MATGARGVSSCRAFGALKGASIFMDARAIRNGSIVIDEYSCLYGGLHAHEREHRLRSQLGRPAYCLPKSLVPPSGWRTDFVVAQMGTARIIRSGKVHKALITSEI